MFQCASVSLAATQIFKMPIMKAKKQKNQNLFFCFFNRRRRCRILLLIFIGARFDWFDKCLTCLIICQTIRKGHWIIIRFVLMCGLAWLRIALHKIQYRPVDLFRIVSEIESRKRFRTASDPATDFRWFSLSFEVATAKYWFSGELCTKTAQRARNKRQTSFDWIESGTQQKLQ